MMVQKSRTRKEVAIMASSTKAELLQALSELSEDDIENLKQKASKRAQKSTSVTLTDREKCSH